MGERGERERARIRESLEEEEAKAMLLKKGTANPDGKEVSRWILNEGVFFF